MADETTNNYENFTRWNDETSLNIEEFHPNSSTDSMWENLRRLFVESFEHFYVEHLDEMNFDSIENLRQWLNESFDDEKQSLIEGKHRCFTLSKENLLAFVIFRLDDEENVTLLRLVVRADLKRQGFGSKLFEDFSRRFSPWTNFYLNLRRINQPALNFFLKHGATILPDNDQSSVYLTLHFNLTQTQFDFNDQSNDDERDQRYLTGNSATENDANANLRCCSLI